MHIDWECPYCTERHISSVCKKDVYEKNKFFITCSSCNKKSIIHVIQQKYFAECEPHDNIYHTQSKTTAIIW